MRAISPAYPTRSTGLAGETLEGTVRANKANDSRERAKHAASSGLCRRGKQRSATSAAAYVPAVYKRLAANAKPSLSASEYPTGAMSRARLVDLSSVFE